ncbi:MAG: type II toxin-antitoxin system ParD family antitoxin [Planctomycetes bacterium]|nr:type II toxin-antitoxin system ParD family antitoxin [Planctomycetota bacterium]
MNYEIPAQLQSLIDQKMSTGQYASQDELLTEALHALDDYEAAVADIQQGIEDEATGRMRPLDEVNADIRQKLGFSK